MSIFKPMLAANLGSTPISVYPCCATPKVDGIRCIVRDGTAYSRSNKPLRNRHLQNLIRAHAAELDLLDGEIVVGNPTDKDVYRTTQSAVNSYDGEPDFRFLVFDDLQRPQASYVMRCDDLAARKLPAFCGILPYQKLYSMDEVVAYEASQLEAGYEGIMLRNPASPYKQGRSTLTEFGLVKIKRFVDDEALVIGYGPLMHNGNEAVKDELGHTSRSSAKVGLEERPLLGYLECVTKDGTVFRIGTGFNQADREQLWQERETLCDRLVKYKYFEVGIKEAPRHPVWLGFRDPDDTDTKIDVMWAKELYANRTAEQSS